MKLGILGTADVALRRFLPALQSCQAFQYAGVATRGGDRAATFREAFGGRVYDGYAALLEDPEIEAVYIPLPPALHFAWAKQALSAGKHVLLEKPFTVSAGETRELLELAASQNLAVHENYMFLFHSQLRDIKARIASGELGDIRLLRMSFGFPRRSAEDFRYDRDLGGGALLDCGGYPVRLALELLGDDLQVTEARLSKDGGIDLYGSAVLEGGGLCAQIAFGMDNAYQCSLEVWGSRVTLTAPRVFTAGAGVAPELILRSSTDTTTVTLPKDDHFRHSIDRFAALIEDPALRPGANGKILRQAELIDDIRNMGGCL